MQSGTLTKNKVVQFNNIDKSIIIAMTQTEQKLPPKRSMSWTTELSTIVHKVRYPRLLLWKQRGIGVSTTNICKASATSNCEWTSNSEAKILQKLRATWQEVDFYYKNNVKKREAVLAVMAKITPGLSTDNAKAILQIKIEKREN